MGFKDRSAAMRMRDVIVAIANRQIERLRPRPTYGVVQTINRGARTCTVLFAGDVNPVTIGMGSVQPSATSQTVRVEGVAGDRYVAAVMGAAYYA